MSVYRYWCGSNGVHDCVCNKYAATLGLRVRKVINF